MGSWRGWHVVDGGVLKSGPCGATHANTITSACLAEHWEVGPCGIIERVPDTKRSDQVHSTTLSVSVILAWLLAREDLRVTFGFDALCSLRIVYSVAARKGREDTPSCQALTRKGFHLRGPFQYLGHKDDFSRKFQT